MRRILTPVVALALTLTACGSGDTSEAAGETAQTTISEEAAATTVAPTTTAAVVDPAEYCRLSQVSNDLNDTVGDLEDPVVLEEYMTELGSLLDQAVAAAPAEIAAEMVIIDAQFDALVTTVAENGYEFSALMTAVNETESAEADAASDTVDAYDLDVCGISDGSDEAATGEDSAEDEGAAGNALTVESFETARSSEATRTVMIDGMIGSRDLTAEQAGCFIDEVSPELFVVLGNDLEPETAQLTELFELLDTCSIPLDAMSPS